MEFQLSGKLTIAASEQPSFAGCRIEAQFVRDPFLDLPVSSRSKPKPKSAATELAETGKSTEPIESDLESVPERIAARAVKGPVQVSALSDAAGNFTLVFPEKLDIHAMSGQISVFSPLGNVILSKELSSKELIASGDEPITLTVPKFDVLLEKPEPEQPPTRRIRGRVIERSGKLLPPCIQVLLLGSEQDAEKSDLTPILAAKADSAGYFLGTIKNPKYKKVVAQVTGVPNEIEVRLADSRIPPHIPIVVELPDQPKNSLSNDCKCSNTSDVPRTPTQEELEEMCGTFSADLGTNQCIRFNVPNRAIEEFNFYSVIRTTDPIINGITIDPHDREVAIPTIPLAQEEGGSKETSSPQKNLSANVIETAIQAALPPSNFAIGSGGAEPSWSDLESLIRQAVIRVGGSPLDQNFFYQFLGWGQGSVWGYPTGAAYGSARNQNISGDPSALNRLVQDQQKLILVIKKASEDGTTRATENATLPPQKYLSVKVNVIETAIKAALPPSNFATGSGGAEPSWSQLESLIRQAVIKVGASPLDQNFFYQFLGWGQGSVWGYPTGAAYGSAVSQNNSGDPAALNRLVQDKQKLDGVVKKAAAREIMSTVLRAPLDNNNQVDWDDTPTFYQAASIAHGHLLHFKQVWYADGYSLGDLIQSLPLAPGQKKLISIIDWERREQASREEFTTAEEGLNAALARDRDLKEVVSGTLSETSRGESHNRTEGFGAGKGSAGSGSYGGFNFGGVMGVSGGTGSSNTKAFLESARNLASSSLQTLRDRTLQSASAVRSLRSTIVQTAAQGETVRATTEVVANHNHCHALTIQYFEVLRHFKVTNELTDVQECLFVPLPMTGFNRPKVLRWRESISRYLKRPELKPAIDATERIETNWEKEYTPQARYADEQVSAIFGELTLTILIPLPPFPEKPKPKPGETLEQTAEAARKAMGPAEDFLRITLAIGTLGASEAARAATQTAVNVTKAVAQGAHAMAESLSNELSAEERYARFQQEVMPGAAAGFVDQLELYALVGASEVRLNGADFTLVSEYRPGTPMLVSVRGRIATPVRRASIAALVVKSGVPLPAGCRVIVNSASLRYQTAHFRHSMINDPRVNDDIDLPIVAGTGTPDVPALPIPPLPGFPTRWTQIPGVTPIRNGNGAMLYTPLDEWEQKAPRLEDIRLSAELITHLNENLEYYHHAIWWAMDPSRRYMLLDRYTAPNGDGRSVASVVDNTLIGIVGNSLILPVAPGNRLEPTFKLASNVTLLEHYDPQSPAPPSRVSLPTRGVFAEAVMGDCNACEEIDDTRFWRWEESPIDEPPALDMAALASRRSEPNYGTPTSFPTPIVNIQNAPQAPDPTGVKAVLDVLGKESPFRDITGFAGTQANAAAAFSKAMDTALAFGKEASQLAQQAAMTQNIGQTMRAIDKAEGENKIDKDKAKQLRASALEKMTGDTPSDPKAASVADRLKVIDEQQTKGSISAEQAAQRRAEVMKGLEPEDITKTEESRAATEAMRKMQNIESVETKDADGDTTKVTARPGSIPGLIASGLLGATARAGGPWKAAAEIGIEVGKQVAKSVTTNAGVEVKGFSAGSALLKEVDDPSKYAPGDHSFVEFYFADLGGVNVTDNLLYAGLRGRIRVEWTECALLDTAAVTSLPPRKRWLAGTIGCKKDIETKEDIDASTLTDTIESGEIAVELISQSGFMMTSKIIVPDGDSGTLVSEPEIKPRVRLSIKLKRKTIFGGGWIGPWSQTFELHSRGPGWIPFYILSNPRSDSDGAIRVQAVPWE